ncbi:MAG: hypothetical protein AAF560_16570, partial [Acidobacteriota bacterium]
MNRPQLDSPSGRGTTIGVRPLLLKGLIVAVLLAAVSAPAWGYIVFLKDGSQITTKTKYRIEGDKAILILPSGTEASYDASEIDVEKTEAVNVIDYGNAKLLEGVGGETLLPKGARFEEEDSEFGEFISGRSLALPEVRRRDAATAKTPGGPPTTQAGFLDLLSLRRKPYPNSEITTEVLGYLKGQGVDRVRIYQGTEPDRPLIEVVAASEASVFKVLQDSANGLVQIHERFPRDVAAFELLLMTESQARAGQFILTPERATL